jgi:hypothetical protein
MFPRYFAIATGLALFSSRLAYAQVDAQDRTQSFFDDHKGADVTNPDRVITNTVRRPPTAVQVSTLPPLTKAVEPNLTKANAMEIAKLRNQKETFVKQEVTKKTKGEQSVAGPKAATLDVRNMTRHFEKRWDDTQDGRRLKRLERSATTGSTLPPLTR